MPDQTPEYPRSFAPGAHEGSGETRAIPVAELLDAIKRNCAEGGHKPAIAFGPPYGHKVTQCACGEVRRNTSREVPDGGR